MTLHQEQGSWLCLLPFYVSPSLIIPLYFGWTPWTSPTRDVAESEFKAQTTHLALMTSWVIACFGMKIEESQLFAWSFYSPNPVSPPPTFGDQKDRGWNHRWNETPRESGYLRKLSFRQHPSPGSWLRWCTLFLVGFLVALQGPLTAPMWRYGRPPRPLDWNLGWPFLMEERSRSTSFFVDFIGHS